MTHHGLIRGYNTKNFCREDTKISEITASLPFTEYDFLQKYRDSFRISELGRIHERLPLKELAAKLIPQSCSGKRKGRKPLFPPEGELALMFLKPSRPCPIIGNLRATVMEGSFGNQKLHYGMGCIQARNRRSEILQIFFGIHMANAAVLAARHLAKEEAPKRKRKSA